VPVGSFYRASGLDSSERLNEAAGVEADASESKHGPQVSQQERSRDQPVPGKTPVARLL
jgi:hypothetical protein